MYYLSSGRSLQWMNSGLEMGIYASQAEAGHTEVLMHQLQEKSKPASLLRGLGRKDACKQRAVLQRREQWWLEGHNYHVWQ